MKNLLTKSLAVFAVALTLAFAMLVCASAADIVDSGTCGADGDNLTWTFDSEGTLTISGEGAMEDYPYITASWLSNSKIVENMTNIVIEEGVTSISDYAFFECYAAKDVRIPGSVTSIGDYAFQHCTLLASVTIPNNVTSIGYHAFFNCESLTSVTIPNSVTSIGERAFSYCDNLTIYGYTGSTAETYATENDILFVALKECTVTKVVGATSTVEIVEDGEFTLWAAPELASGEFVGWTDGEALYRAGDTYNLTGDATFEVVVLDTYMEEGASVRLNAQNSGIRFTTNIGREGYDLLEEVAADLMVGTIIVPTDYIPGGELSLETPKVVNILNGTIDDISWKNITATEYSYGGSLVNILPNNYIRNFSGIGYVTVEYADGSSETF